ncbi:VOC family protein [Candidatus Roizmanbacteria bacterium]|nr:VOC family protein [Candidatus Roizmanbacteria bacterium]
MLTLSSIMVGSSHAKELIHFYKKILDREPDMVEGNWAGWQLGHAFFSVGEHSEVKGKAKEPGRMMFNLETTEVKKEFKRISELGAKVIKEPYDMGGSLVATFEDPDGNYFQLMSPWKS